MLTIIFPGDEDRLVGDADYRAGDERERVGANASTRVREGGANSMFARTEVLLSEGG